MASFDISDKDAFETRCIDTVRVLSADMVEKAKSGHPGAPMGCAPIAHVLFEDMTYTPSSPEWFNRDRFVLSNGHSCALYYSMLHLTGYGMSLDDLKAFRQFGSITPGHPENAVTLGVEVRETVLRAYGVWCMVYGVWHIPSPPHTPSSMPYAILPTACLPTTPPHPPPHSHPLPPPPLSYLHTHRCQPVPWDRA
jgi:hypothetical protein